MSDTRYWMIYGKEALSKIHVIIRLPTYYNHFTAFILKKIVTLVKSSNNTECYVTCI